MSGWVRSSSCASGECLEVRLLDSGWLRIRDSRNPGLTLPVSPAEWDAFLAGAKAGNFDNLTGDNTS